MAKYLRITKTVRLISLDSKEYNFAIIGEVLKIVGTFYSAALKRDLPVVEVSNGKDEVNKYLFVHHNIEEVIIDEHEAPYYTLFDRAVQDQSTCMRVKMLSYIKGDKRL